MDARTHARARCNMHTKGETFVSLNGALMKLYMEKYGLPHSAFAPFPLVAHANASLSEEAVFHKKGLDAEQFEAAASIWGPVETPLSNRESARDC